LVPNLYTAIYCNTTDMYVYRNEVFNRRGYIHNLYHAEMSALYKGNSQGIFYGTVYSS